MPPRPSLLPRPGITGKDLDIRPEIPRRVVAALKLLGEEGMRDGQASAIIANRFRVTPRTARSDVFAARAILTQADIEDPAAIKRRLVERLERQIAVAEDEGDSKAIALLSKTLSDIVGANAPLQHNHTGGVLVVGVSGGNAADWKSRFDAMAVNSLPTPVGKPSNGSNGHGNGENHG